MSQVSYYCLGCELQGNCKCGTDLNRFNVSPKLRIPTTKNKVVFRQFLEDCPIFVNCVPEHLKPKFLDLLRKVKYFNRSINGHKWTNIKS